MKCLRNNKSRIGSLPLIYFVIIILSLFFITFLYNQKLIKIENLKNQSICTHEWMVITTTEKENNIKIKCKKCKKDYYEYKEEQLNDKT